MVCYFSRGLSGWISSYFNHLKGSNHFGGDSPAWLSFRKTAVPKLLKLGFTYIWSFKKQDVTCSYYPPSFSPGTTRSRYGSKLGFRSPSCTIFTSRDEEKWWMDFCEDVLACKDIQELLICEVTWSLILDMHTCSWLFCLYLTRWGWLNSHSIAEMSL